MTIQYVYSLAQRSGKTLLITALGELGEYRQVAEALVEWGAEYKALGRGCIVCGQGRGHDEACPYPLAEAALAPKDPAPASPEGQGS